MDFTVLPTARYRTRPTKSEGRKTGHCERVWGTPDARQNSNIPTFRWRVHDGSAENETKPGCKNCGNKETLVPDLEKLSQMQTCQPSDGSGGVGRCGQVWAGVGRCDVM